MEDRRGQLTEIGRRRLLRAGGAAIAGGVVGGVGGVAAQDDETTRVTVKQEAGRLTYWVLPGPRRLSKQVFGTPENPKSLVEPVIERANKQPIKELLRKFPILVGVPLDKRVVKDGEFVRTTFPTPFSDNGRVVDGEFELEYIDRQDREAKPGKSSDDVDLTVRFTDPQRNNYELELLTVFDPGIPGYKTGGGVRTDFFHHGLTDTGSPLMPKVYSWGGFWAIGNVIVDGQVVDRRKVVHFMTTQTVRTENYDLAIEETLPLRPENTIAGQLHHTHAIVEPVKITKQGIPQFEPVQTPLKQGFIHVMFEEDTIVDAPFEPQFPTEFPQQTPQEEQVPGDAREIRVRGQEYAFDPERITVEQGQKVAVRFRNIGTIAHNFTLPRFGVGTKTIQPGTTATVVFTPEEVGEFTYICDVPGHAAQGMRGTFIVTP